MGKSVSGWGEQQFNVHNTTGYLPVVLLLLLDSEGELDKCLSGIRNLPPDRPRPVRGGRPPGGRGGGCVGCGWLVVGPDSENGAGFGAGFASLKS